MTRSHPQPGLHPVRLAMPSPSVSKTARTSAEAIWAMLSMPCSSAERLSMKYPWTASVYIGPSRFNAASPPDLS